MALVLASLTILKNVSASKQALYNSSLLLIKNLIDCLQSSDTSSSPQLKKSITGGSSLYTIRYLLGKAIELLVETRCIPEGDVNDLWGIIIDDILIRHGTNEVVLCGVMKYLEFVQKQ